MKTLIKSHPVWTYVLLAYGITWLIQLPGLIALRGNFQFTQQYLMVLNLSSYGPSLAAILVTALLEGWSGVKTLLQRLLQWRVSWWVYLAALFVFPLILFAGYQVLMIQAAPGENLPELFLTLVVLAPLNALVGSILLDIGPLGEELGWRGFMLSRLLERYGDFSSSVILGLVWAFWHLPLFLFPAWRADVPILPAILLYPVSTISIAYVMTKLHHWGGGSILIAILYHGIVNYAVGYIQERDLWNLGHLSPLQLDVIVIGLFVLTAFVFGFFSKISSTMSLNRVARVERYNASRAKNPVR
ncbi:MAG TPA: type II CAAX endopeptidase family protein [Anaerolineales bacterium]|nr:type II CAAX endopeptidase family protein [Anaerolineales bacterium]